MSAARRGTPESSERVARPPDRFVAGEESALVNWIDAQRALPVFRPDKGTPLRIGKRPVLVHNAETLAHIALIARQAPMGSWPVAWSKNQGRHLSPSVVP